MVGWTRAISKDGKQIGWSEDWGQGKLKAEASGQWGQEPTKDLFLLLLILTGQYFSIDF